MKKENWVIVGLIGVLIFCIFVLIYSGNKDEIKSIELPNKTIEDVNIDKQEIKSLNFYLESEKDLISLIGLTAEDLYKNWGNPTGTLSGLYGEIWKIDEEHDMIVYYDFETQKISNVAIDNRKIDEESNFENKDIEVQVKEISSIGCTYTLNVFEKSEKEYDMGSMFYLEKYENGSWNKVKPKIPESEIFWTDVLYTVSKELVEFNENWEELYGYLNQGKYRIVKIISYLNDKNEYISENLFINFEI